MLSPKICLGSILAPPLRRRGTVANLLVPSVATPLSMSIHAVYIDIDHIFGISFILPFIPQCDVSDFVGNMLRA